MGNSFGEDLLDVFSKHGQLCVGLDPSSEQLYKWGLPESAAGVEQFCNRMIDECRDSVGILKPQVSFFEQFGSAGFAVLERVLKIAHDASFLVIADGKRGDIGSTMNGYSRAWLALDAPFLCDALTLSPYLGPESLTETIVGAVQNGKGVFILSTTSNPEALPLQSSIGSGHRSVAASVTAYTNKFNSKPLGSVGAVLGPGTDFRSLGIDEKDLMRAPILAPGFGAQGALLSDARLSFGSLSKNVIFNMSRFIAGDSLDGIRVRVQAAKKELEIGLAT